LVKEKPFVFQKAEGVGHPVDHPRPAGGNVRGKEEKETETSHRERQSLRADWRYWTGDIECVWLR
jgi:hypothetical protein